MKALIIGAARSGIAIANLLCKQGYFCTLIDQNSIEQAKLDDLTCFRLIEGEHSESLWDEEFDIIVKSPGIPYTNAFVLGFEHRGHFIYNEIEIALRFASNYQIAAITGTNGKTTTTTLLGEMLKRKNVHNVACGNIGLALSEVVYRNGNVNIDCALEIAAFQLIGCREFKPKISTILNLAPDHLDVFSNVDEYYHVKNMIYMNQDGNDVFLRNIDDVNIERLTQDVKANCYNFSLYQDADVYLKDNGVFFKDVMLFEKDKLKIYGKHNLSNAMVAATMAYLMDVSLEDIQYVIENFKGVEHRLEYVDTINGVAYFNDSKATTAESTIVALEAFDEAVILLAGGYDKKTGFQGLKPHLSKIKQLIAFGATKEQFKEIYPKTILVDNMQEALAYAFSLAQVNDNVILSPACASYDQFNNYEERGLLFKKYVNSLKD